MVFSSAWAKLASGFFLRSTPNNLLTIFEGPGNCLGLLAAKTSPTAVRGQFYGVAAAIGKVGAFAGTWGMFYTYPILIHAN